MRRLLIRLAAVCLIFLLCLGLFEGLCSGLAYYQYGTLDTEKLNASDLNNSYIASMGGSFPEHLKPHPYVGWTRSLKGGANNVGLASRDYPSRRDPTKFTILVTGGSVADQFAGGNALEKILNEEYSFERPVVVLNGACGVWKQPQQMIWTALYGDVVDAVITLDGFNEHYAFQGRIKRLEMPGNRYFELNPLTSTGFDEIGKSWLAGRLREFSQSHNSRAIFYVTKALRPRVEPRTEVLQEDSRFAMPADVQQKGKEFNLEQYKKYIRLTDVIARELGIRSVHFVQPCPAIGKTLTVEEQRVALDLSYRDVYQHMTDELLAMKGTTVVSLLDVFADHPEKLYADWVHCDFNGPGYTIMAHRIAQELSRLWDIKQKHP